MDDLELISRVLAGEAEYFNSIILKYELVILGFIRKMTGDFEASRDITQEVFITAYNKLYSFKSQYKFLNWLLQIARNKSIDYLRRVKKEISIDSIGEITSPSPTPQQVLEYKETRYLINSFLRGLKKIDKEILMLKFTCEEMRFHDISQILNMRESTVKTKYYRMWEKFKHYVNNQEGDAVNNELQNI